MTNRSVFDAMRGIDTQLILDAAPAEKPKKNIATLWIKWGTMAACLCLAIGIAFCVSFGFVPNQMTDRFREGTLIEITSESELPATYDGNLLAFNLDFEKYELYYKNDGAAENTDDWYSLLALNSNSDRRIILHCLFGDTTVDDWKVSMVFTKKATQTKIIDGIEVQIARQEPSMQYEYWYYALFEYDDVVYDIRVQSNDPDYIYEVLDTLLGVNG